MSKATDRLLDERGAKLVVSLKAALLRRGYELVLKPVSRERRAPSPGIATPTAQPEPETKAETKAEAKAKAKAKALRVRLRILSEAARACAAERRELLAKLADATEAWSFTGLQREGLIQALASAHMRLRALERGDVEARPFGPWDA